MLIRREENCGFGAIQNKLIQLYICILNCYFLSTLLDPYRQSVALVCRLTFSADHSMMQLIIIILFMIN